MDEQYGHLHGLSFLSFIAIIISFSFIFTSVTLILSFNPSSFMILLFCTCRSPFHVFVVINILKDFLLQVYFFCKKISVRVPPPTDIIEPEIINYTTIDRNGYKIYKSDPNKCKSCPYLQRCTKSKNHQKVISRHIWQDYLDISEEYRYTTKGKEEYKRRKETIERQFGSAKEFHGFRYTNMKGIQKMEMKAALTFACLNMKKLALMMYRMDPNKEVFTRLFSKIHKNFETLLNLIKISKPRKKFLGLSSL